VAVKRRPVAAGCDQYVLGYRRAELERLQRHADQLAPDSTRLFDEIGIFDGAHVLEIGCGLLGFLELLSGRDGASGRVVGVEIEADAITFAKANVVERNLSYVEVWTGDARSTGLPAGSFDLVTARLVLINIPRPEEVISEAVKLARPGGVVAFHEVDKAAVICHPPSHAWTTLVQLFGAVCESNGNDWSFGRKLPRLLKQAGLADIHVNPIVHAYQPGNPRRTILVDFADNFKQHILALGLVSERDLAELRQALASHLDDPNTVVFDGPYIQAWGRKPA
jgi:ubiquinone/menaquinone biosynthesis C-methylase UbiE